jgi:hypothetical protein
MTGNKSSRIARVRDASGLMMSDKSSRLARWSTHAIFALVQIHIPRMRASVKTADVLPPINGS